MNDMRMAELFNEAMRWIWEHTGEYDVIQYAIACANIGMTKEELDNELAECGFDRAETDEILESISDYYGV